MTLVTIELAGKPRGKGRPRSRIMRKGKGPGASTFIHTYTPPETQSYEAALRYAAQEAMAGRPLLEGAVVLTLEAWMPIPASWSGKRRRMAQLSLLRPTTRPDFDNLNKTLDALNKVVWRDDAQVVSWSGFKRYDSRPRLVITARQLDPADTLGITARTEKGAQPAAAAA
jgi:Holliday junction resolvase RusA-like endonuclease